MISTNIPPTDLSEKELELLRSIGQGGAASQRSLSERVGVSLGITNLLLRRLIEKGYVKVTALNRRSVRYILTPKGFAEKLRKSYAFALRTLRAHEAIRRKLELVVHRELSQGRRRFHVVGEGDLADLVGLILDGLRAESVEWSRGRPRGAAGTILFAEPSDSASRDGIDLVAELSEDEIAKCAS